MKYHKLGDLEQNLLSHNSENYESENKNDDRSLISRNPLEGRFLLVDSLLQLHLFIQHSPHVCSYHLPSESVQISLFIRTLLCHSRVHFRDFILM